MKVEEVYKRLWDAIQRHVDIDDEINDLWTELRDLGETSNQIQERQGRCIDLAKRLVLARKGIAI